MLLDLWSALTDRVASWFHWHPDKIPHPYAPDEPIVVTKHVKARITCRATTTTTVEVPATASPPLTITAHAAGWILTPARLQHQRTEDDLSVLLLTEEDPTMQTVWVEELDRMAATRPPLIPIGSPAGGGGTPATGKQTPPTARASVSLPPSISCPVSPGDVPGFGAQGGLGGR